MQKQKLLYLVLALAVLLGGCVPGTTRLPATGGLFLRLELDEEVEASLMVVELARNGTELPPEKRQMDGNEISLWIPRLQVGLWDVRVKLFHDDLQVAQAVSTVIIEADSESFLELKATPLAGSVEIIVDWERVPAPVAPPHSAKLNVVMQHLGNRVSVYPQFRDMQSSSRNVAGFNLYRTTKVDGDYTLIGTSTWDASGLVVEDRSIVTGATYYYRLTSLTPDGRESWYSATYTLNVAEVGHPLYPAEAVSDRRPLFTWTDVAGHSQYKVHLFNDNQPVAVDFAFDLTGTNPVAVPLRDLEPGQYRWYVVAQEGDKEHVRFFVTDMGYFEIVE